jgi:hypothetical protein
MSMPPLPGTLLEYLLVGGMQHEQLGPLAPDRHCTAGL